MIDTGKIPGAYLRELQSPWWEQIAPNTFVRVAEKNTEKHVPTK